MLRQCHGVGNQRGRQRSGGLVPMALNSRTLIHESSLYWLGFTASPKPGLVSARVARELGWPSVFSRILPPLNQALFLRLAAGVSAAYLTVKFRRPHPRLQANDISLRSGLAAGIEAEWKQFQLLEDSSISRPFFDCHTLIEASGQTPRLVQFRSAVSHMSDSQCSPEPRIAERHRRPAG
jgi:hypothetical protein